MELSVKDLDRSHRIHLWTEYISLEENGKAISNAKELAGIFRVFL